MHRTRLLVGTALFALALSPPAAAQFPFITDVAVTTGGGAPVISDVGALRLVTLNAPRTYLNHGQGFFLSSDLTLRFDFSNPGRDGVALLRADSGFTILGTVEGRLGPAATDPLGGNLWLFTRGGLILAEGGRVAAGGILLANALPELLTTPAGRQQLLANDALVIEANLGPLLTTGALILPGASVEASDGFLAIVAQNVQQAAGADIRASRGTALVGAATSFTLRLARNATNDFDLVEFEVPAGGGTRDGGAPIDLAGSVRGGNVWLSLVGSSTLVSAIVRATGTVVASAATVDQGQIVLSAGSGIAGNEPGPPRDAAPTRIRAELADLAADGGIRIRQDEGELSTAVAGGDIRIVTRTAVPAGETALGALEAGGSILVDVGGDVTGLAPFTAGGDIIVRGQGAVTLGSLSAGDDIVAVAGGPLVAGDFGTTIESRNDGPDVTRDGDDTDPSRDGPPPIRSLHLESQTDGVRLVGLVAGFTQGSVRSARAFDIDINTGTSPVFLDDGLSLTTPDTGATSRIALDDSFSGIGASIRFSDIESGPLRITGFSSLSIGRLSAVGFAGIDVFGDVSIGDARVTAFRGNPGSLGIASDFGSIILSSADVDGDLILVARQGAVVGTFGADLRFGDDFYAISGRGNIIGQGIRFTAGATIASKPGFPDVAGNEILEDGDPALLVGDFDRDFPGNGRVAELLALAQFGQFPAGISGDARFEGRIEGLDRLVLESDSASVLLVAPEARLPDLVALAGQDLTLVVEAVGAPSFLAGRDATLVVTGTDLVEIVESGAGRDLAITAGGALTLASALTGRDATLTAASLDASGLAGSIRNARFTTTEADLAVEALSVSGTIELTSAGALSAGTLEAADDIVLAAAGALAAASLDAGRDILLAAEGELEVTEAAAGRDLAARGAALRLGAFSAGRDLDLETTRDDLVLAEGLSAARNLRLASAAGLSADGPLSAGGTIALRAREDAPLGLLAVQDATAGGDLDARAWTVSARRLAAGGSARVVGTGPASIEADEIVADDDVDLDSPLIRIGFVRSTGLGPDADGDGFNVRLAGGLGEFIAIEAPTDIRARMTGALSLADAIAGRDADLEAQSLRIEVRQTGLLAGRDARLVAATTLEAGRVSAGDDATIEAGGAATLGTVEARGTGEDSEGDGANIRLVAAGAQALALAAPGDIIVDATSGPAVLGQGGGVAAGRDLAVTGTTLDLADASAGRDLRLTATAGDIIGPEFAAVRDLVLAASGRIETGTATAGRDLELAAGDSLDILSLASAGRDARLVGGSVAGPLGFPFTIAAGRDIAIESTDGPVSVRATAGDDVRVRSAGTLRLGATTTGNGEDTEGDGSRIDAEAGGETFLEASSAAGDLELKSGGPVRGQGTAAAGGSIRIAGAGVQLPLGATAGLDAEIRATGGLLFTSGLVRAGRDVVLAGADGDRVNVGGQGLAAGRDIAISGDEITASSGAVLAAGRDARLLGTGFIGIRQATLEAGRDVEIATDRGINFGRLVAGDDIRVVSGSGLVLGDEVLTTGLGPDDEGDGSTVRVSGTLVELASGRSAGDMLLSGRDAVFAGFRDGVAVAPGLTVGRDLVVLSDSVQFNLAGIGRNLDAEARTGGLDVAGSISAPGSVRLQALLFLDVAGGISAGADVDVRSRVSIVRVDGPVTAGDDLRLAAGAPGVRAGALTTTGLGPDGEGDGPVMEVRGGTITLGPVLAAQDFVAESPGAVAVESIRTARDARVTAASLALGATGGIGRDLLVTATGAGFSAPGPLAAGRDIRVTGAGNVQLAALAAGRDVGLEAGGSLETGAIAAPGRLSARAARMRLGDATVGGEAALETTAGELALPGTLTTGGDLRLRAPEAAGGILRLGRISAGGLVDARAFSILSAPGGSLVAARGPIRMVGTGSATIDLEEVVSDDDVDLQSPSIRVGRVRSTGLGPDRAGDGFNIRLDGGTGTFGTLDAPTDILARFDGGLAVGGATAGRDSVLSAGAGALVVGSATTSGLLTLVGRSLELRQTLAAREARFVATGPARFGGEAGGPGFVVSAADLARISAPGGISASTGAVPRATTPQGPASAAFEQAFGTGGTADLVVDRFAFDPKRFAVLGFFAGAAARIRVVGDVTPTEAGGRIILGANPVPGLTPGAVLVSASLGAGQLFLQDCYVALFPLENIAITALGDVIFGNAAFQQAVAAADPAAIDVQAGTPGLPPSPRDDRLWVVADSMTIAAPGRIVAQNTSSVPGSFAGLVLANRRSTPLLSTVLRVTGGSVVDLSGIVVDGAGRAFFGPQAARSGAILATNPSARFNGCTIAGTESCLPPLADPSLGFRPEQFVPLEPLAPEPDRLRGAILFELADRGQFRIGVEDGAILIRRDEEEERPDRATPGR